MKTKTIIKTYSDLVLFPTLYERYNYLKLGGRVGDRTFGFDRYLNQELYRSRRWKEARDYVIIRDGGNDLGLEDFPIGRRIMVHHMNPLTIREIEDGAKTVFDPEGLICVSPMTHNAIHFGDIELLPKPLIERSRYDTCPWRKE